jgi:hypothetical protein
MNNELESIWEEAVGPNSRCYPGICPGRTEENHKTFGLDSNRVLQPR